MADLVQTGYQGGNDPTSTLAQTLGFLLPGSENMPVAERQAFLIEQMSDVFQELDAIARNAWDSRKDKSSK